MILLHLIRKFTRNMVTGHFKTTLLVVIILGLTALLVIYTSLDTGVSGYFTYTGNKTSNLKSWNGGLRYTGSHENLSPNNIQLEFEFNFTHDGTREAAMKCNETFKESFAENLLVVENYPKGIAEEYYPLLGVNRTIPRQVTEYPVIVTAFNQPFYKTSQGLFRSIHILNDTDQYSGKIQCLVYDLGVNTDTLNTIKTKSRCEVRRFPFEEFPAHVRNLKTYAFKPIVVQMALMDYGFVWWTDSMIRVNSTYLDLAVAYLKKYGWIFKTTKSDKDDFSLTKQTNLRMFKFLGEDLCKFRPFGELWASSTLFYFNEVTRVVVKAWVSCALNERCISPKGSRIYCHTSQPYDGRCHRYDQSMLGIIARRLYHDQHRYPLDHRLDDIYREGRGDIIKYF